VTQQCKLQIEGRKHRSKAFIIIIIIIIIIFHNRISEAEFYCGCYGKGNSMAAGVVTLLLHKFHLVNTFFSQHHIHQRYNPKIPKSKTNGTKCLVQKSITYADHQTLSCEKFLIFVLIYVSQMSAESEAVLH
jgi:hypothetical protein